MKSRIGLALTIGLMSLPACDSEVGSVDQGWTGTMETLPSGQHLVRNERSRLWPADYQWHVIEDLRIGRVVGEGPDSFGSVESLEVDETGRIWVLDGLARELRVFEASGSYVRTVGREGQGPGEFMLPLAVELAPDDKIWVTDLGNRRISLFDTAGTHIEDRRLQTSIVLRPWRGGLDDQGNYYAPVAVESDPTDSQPFALTRVRYDSALVPLDTLNRPRDPIRRDFVEFRGSPTRIPFQGALTWQVSRAGTVWALLTDEYRLFELSWQGDTLRTINRTSDALPVTDQDLEELTRSWALEDEPGGQPDWWGRIPRTKPSVTGSFFIDDEHNIWVEQHVEPSADEGMYDVFDQEGRYLGAVAVPRLYGKRFVRDGFLYGVTRDNLDVPHVIRARIVR